jgi:hypothetical protein
VGYLTVLYSSNVSASVIHYLRTPKISVFPTLAAMIYYGNVKHSRTRLSRLLMKATRQPNCRSESVYGMVKAFRVSRLLLQHISTIFADIIHSSIGREEFGCVTNEALPDLQSQRACANT